MGYPRTTCGAEVMPQGRDLAALLAERLEDGDDNANNRFDVAADLNEQIARGLGLPHGPFWGCTTRPPAGLNRTRPEPFPVPEYRACEAQLRARGHLPQSPWKLAYPASVGSQTLTGMARLHGLLTDPAIGPRCWLWPFEPAPDRPDGIAIAEIWPGLSAFDAPRYAGVSEIRDARQVIATLDMLRRLDPRTERADGAGGWILNAATAAGRQAD